MAPTSTPTTPQPFTALKPPSVLLMGDIGTGKTWALHTLLKSNLKTIVIVTEPGGEESLLNACEQTETPIDNLHWKYIPFASSDWDTLEDMIDRIGRMDYEALSKLKMGPGKGNYRQLINLHASLSNFTCDRTGENFGPVDKLNDEFALAIDSLSGLNQMCMDLVIGAKPSAHQGEWGVAMNTEERLINKFTSDLRCFFVMTSHLDKIRDEITGRLVISPMLLGNKLAPKIPRMFSEVILARREDRKFMWSTSSGDTALKARSLPISDTIEPSFEQIVAAYRKRKERVTNTVSKNEEDTETETAKT